MIGTGASVFKENLCFLCVMLFHGPDSAVKSA